MGIGGSACKGLIRDDEGDGVERSVSTVTKLPFLPQFEDRPPFRSPSDLADKDVALLKALTHHRTPFAVVDIASDDLKVLYASGGFVAGMGIPVENIEGTGFASLIKKGIKAKPAEIERLTAAITSQEDTSLVVSGSTGRRNSRNVPFTQFFVTPACDPDGKALFALVSLQPVRGAEAEPSQTMPYRFRRAWTCLKPSSVWSLFTPYKTLCEADAGLVKALQDRREMFCITDPDLYDNPIVFVSDDFVDMTGYNREEINGINCRFLQGEMTSTEDVDVIRYGIREEADMRVCLLNYRKNGTAFLNQFNLSPLRDTEGKLAFFIGVQIEVEDAEVLPFPTTRQTLQEMLMDEEEKDFWDAAEPAPAQERATAPGEGSSHIAGMTGSEDPGVGVSATKVEDEEEKGYEKGLGKGEEDGDTTGSDPTEEKS
uniref:Putative LOV domain-containing protein n=1 Tax=Ishige okamurae TaxID=233772 RepID=A0A126WUS3_9PHAE|nr:putative LOV domain-containing protein [Ishige okamurae]